MDRLRLYKLFILLVLGMSAFQTATADLAFNVLTVAPLVLHSSVSIRHSFETQYGRIGLALQPIESGTEITVTCNPCRISIDKIAPGTVLTTDISLNGSYIHDQVLGTLGIGAARLQILSTLEQGTLSANFSLREVPIADLVEILGSAVPEHQWGVIRGTVHGTGSFTYPSGDFNFKPEVTGFEVEGLGTERLAYGKFDLPSYSSNSTSESGEGSKNWVPLRKIGKNIPRAVVAAEDMRFLEHHGFDLQELELVVHAPRAFNRGGSTITQQVAKNVYLSGERTLARKIRELLYAVEMEQSLGKKRVLELYLNVAPWGDGTRGVREATRHYLHKEPANISAREAAWLASILRNPNGAFQESPYTPISAREQSILDRAKFIKGMHILKRVGS